MIIAQCNFFYSPNNVSTGMGLEGRKFISSGQRNPCPVCGRIKDGDCRMNGEIVLCHTYQDFHKGETLRGWDGEDWACVGTTSDGAGWGIFKIHEPLSRHEPETKPSRWEKPVRPKSEKFFYYPDRHGNPLVRVRRVDFGNGRKSFCQQRWNGKNWQSKLGDLDRSLIPIYRFLDVQRAIAQDQPIFWVEGEALADLLWQIGLSATTSIGGSGGFYNYGDYSHDVQNAKLIICPDRDTKGLQYADQVAEALGGIQWLYAGNPADWHHPKDGYDLADWIAELRSQGMDNDNIRNTLLKQITTKQHKQHHLLTTNQSKKTASNKINTNDFFKKAVQDLYGNNHYICLNQSLYKWIGTHYQFVSDCEELARITSYCKDEKFTPNTIKNILELQKLSTGISPDKVNPKGCLNCLNGVVCWEWRDHQLDIKLIPHSPNLIFIDPPVFNYEPGADPTELNRLMDCLEPEPREILIRTLCCALDLTEIRKRKARIPRAVLLFGTGANGKDAIRTAIFRLFGNSNCTAISLNDFQSYDEGRKFPLADLEFSRLNWSSETVPAGKLDRIESLKLVTTGDPISIERKGIQERRMTPQAVLLFNCNQPPNMTAATEAIKSRYAIIPFLKIYKTNPDPYKGELKADPRFKNDPSFIDQKILPPLLNLLLEKLQQVAVDGINYDPIADQIDELRRRSSHLIQFCEDVGLVEDPNGMVSVPELWAKLEAWYVANNYLSIEQGARGGQKRNWEHPGNGDRCVTASHQVVQRFMELFPKIRRIAIRFTDSEGKDVKQTGLAGLNFAQNIFTTHDNSLNIPNIESPEAATLEHFETTEAEQETEITDNQFPQTYSQNSTTYSDLNTYIGKQVNYQNNLYYLTAYFPSSGYAQIENDTQILMVLAKEIIINP